MDSHSGPELPLKVHGFEGAVKLRGPIRGRPTPDYLALVVLLCACGSDTRDVRGALAVAADAVGQHDPEALFRALDQRSRFALDGIVKARREAKAVITDAYPAAEASQAVTSLGDAATVDGGAQLFAKRCNAACMDGIGAQLAAPRSVREEGRVAIVETVKGERIALYRADSGSYGLTWNTDELVRERTRAYAELELIKKNAALYKAQRALE